MAIKKKIKIYRKRHLQGSKKFPDAPGVYLMKDKAGRILYVGKASSLKKRIYSYFQKPPTTKIQALLGRTKTIDYIQTASSAQALLLENCLIKRHKPYYNAALKDDKSYPFIKISLRDDFPYLSIVRGKREKDARYYGPYTNAKLLKTAIKSIRAIFPFRSCLRLAKRPCLYFHLKLCPGMCVQKVDRQQYRENLRQLGLLLEGRHRELLAELKEVMEQAAKEELFEKAAMFRDKISSLSEIIAQTKESKCLGAVLYPHHTQGTKDGSKGLNEVFIQFKNLILELQKNLDLARPPYRIEAYDVSEIGGAALCGSIVSFVGGRPDKKNYRKFRIKTVQGVNDYAMIRELLHRRYDKSENKQNRALPDLIMIDGGRGHLRCAQAELKQLGLGTIAVIALAKRWENIYTSQGRVFSLPRDSKVLHLLQWIRDEAHRFAISYHRKLRQKDMYASSLDKIPGIGPKRKRLLFRNFKSIQAIKKATVKDLLNVGGIDRRTAENIIRYFNKVT